MTANERARHGLSALMRHLRFAVTLLSLIAVASACGGDPPPADTDQWQVPHQQWPSCGYGPDALAYINTAGEIRMRTLDGLTDDLVVGMADLVARANVEAGFVPNEVDVAPNRRWIAVQLHRLYPDNASVWVAMSCDGKQLLRFGGLPVTAGVVIAPDSFHVAVWRRSGDAGSVLIVDTISGSRRELPAEHALPAAWSMDGKTLYAISGDRETGEDIILSVPALGGPGSKLHQQSFVVPCASRPLNGALYCGLTGLTRYPVDGSPPEHIGLSGNADVSADGRLFGLGFGTLRELDLKAKTETDVWPGGGPEIVAFAF
jgi:hypothetical protein